ncbi:TatD family hydrolase [Neisseria animalis]|uniref:TatD family deoxyribonuclease n=1 Tax=Neisseria animalis TaxID=492 RepID=A0A5P3MW73_NEIAN|nr:TatD family hydrolase [Neisseria animalis]QEY24909.1 TatD family deoxyribonuclease [Neisseria animalis]ROW33359.1 TatD family deoxyribonuclease [Neisseria animalis]
MRFTDSHCHLAEPVWQNNLPSVLSEAEAAGVYRFLVPATAPHDWQQVADLPERPSANQQIRIAFGIHPWFAADISEQNWQSLETLLQQYPQAWVGEAGLDYLQQHKAAWAVQQQVFIRQLELAQRLKRRIIVHNVKASAAVIAAVKAANFTQGGIIHAFSGSLEEAESLIRYGFYIGIGSLLLNPTAKKVRQAAAKLPPERIVLETDSPFMLKNAVNTPANIRRIAAETAALRGISIEELSRQTEKNINLLFADGITPPETPTS